MGVKKFFKNFAGGAAIGVAMIIPGVSGGTVAVLLNVYDDLIDALGNIFKKFKESMALIVPVLLGAVAAFAAAYFPLKYALKYAPLPTVALFAGLMLGSFPKLFSDGKKYSFEKINILSAVIPFVVIIAICVGKYFLNLPAADLGGNMPVWGYFALFFVALLGSCALVVPGVSGSMLLMILGYYEPLFGVISSLISDFGHSVLVLAVFAAGLIVGFFSIAKLMKFFLSKYPRGTRWAIMGFVIGSLPALFITFPTNFPGVSPDGLQVAISLILGALATIGSYAFTAYADGKQKK